jgi:hypothetical protein
MQERETRVKKIQVLDKELRKKIAEKEEELQEFKESIHQIKQDSSSSQWSSSDEGDIHAHEQIVNREPGDFRRKTYPRQAQGCGRDNFSWAGQRRCWGYHNQCCWRYGYPSYAILADI